MDKNSNAISGKIMPQNEHGGLLPPHAARNAASQNCTFFALRKTYDLPHSPSDMMPGLKILHQFSS